MSHQETVRKQKEMGETFDARVLQWKKEAEKEKASNNVPVEDQPYPCGSISADSFMEVEIAPPATFKRYRHLRNGIDMVCLVLNIPYFKIARRNARSIK